METHTIQTEFPHGTVAGYSRGDRCDRCRAAWRDYMRARRGYPRKRLAKSPKPRARARTFYAGKVGSPVTLQLTPLGRCILEAARRRTDKSIGDIFERLLRWHGVGLSFDDSDENVA